jgi:hypothetical protein
VRRTVVCARDWIADVRAEGEVPCETRSLPPSERCRLRTDVISAEHTRLPPLSHVLGSPGGPKHATATRLSRQSGVNRWSENWLLRLDSNQQPSG